jgi:hypothetical protein
LARGHRKRSRPISARPWRKPGRTAGDRHRLADRCQSGGAQPGLAGMACWRRRVGAGDRPGRAECLVAALSALYSPRRCPALSARCNAFRFSA